MTVDFYGKSLVLTIYISVKEKLISSISICAQPGRLPIVSLSDAKVTVDDNKISSNILGFSSAKFLITIILMNFIVANQQNNTYLDLATFTVGIFIYKFTYSLEYLNPEFLYQILISSLVNYFLFRILNITIGKNVLKQKI